MIHISLLSLRSHNYVAAIAVAINILSAKTLYFPVVTYTFASHVKSHRLSQLDSNGAVAFFFLTTEPITAPPAGHTLLRPPTPPSPSRPVRSAGNRTQHIAIKLLAPLPQVSFWFYGSGF